MPKRHLVDRIRSIFLHPESRVTIDAAAELLGWTQRQMHAAMQAGEVETCGGSMIDIREVAETALHLWPLTVIEDALGSEAALAMPPALRTRRILLRLPLYIIGAMQYLAEENGEPVEAFVTRELHGLAYEARERLSDALPGFAEAVEWPFGEATTAQPS